MNKDQVKGAAKQVGGEVQQQVGKLTGDTSTRVKGHAKEAEGKLQEGVGNAKESLKENQRDLDRTRDVNRKLDR
jgi:uncharacterized protein YjbJ (UPF0337 family)